ncbi:MAG: Lrp/AsnC family transcriptional regulator [Eubacteriales bacterium]|nr:Lrp/AsnC family transcriptional regulator [Eubacteriales bacterium]
MTEDEQKILSLLFEDPAYNYVTLAKNLNVSRKTVSVRIKSLKEKGIIQRIGSAKKGYWEILL